MEKQKITVTVAGKPYTLISSDPPEHVRRVAAYVDRTLSETTAATNLPSAQAAVLTCFRIAEELLKAPYLQTAAQLMIAKTAMPALFGDVDLNEALSMLIEEATGALPTGVYFYDGLGGTE